jgi:hypothetical protein
MIDINYQVQLKFGDGTIGSGVILDKDKIHIVFSEQEKRELGHITEMPLEYTPLILMTFDSPASIDVIIALLEEAKNRLIKNI